MPKAIAVIDMPANCKECRFFNEIWEEDALGYAKDYVCAFGCSYIGRYIGRPMDCPLRPMPSKDECYPGIKEYNKGFIDGRNYIIEQIEEMCF